MNVPGWRDMPAQDPWPDAPTVPFGLHDGHTSPIGFVAPAPQPAARRRVHGRIYELITGRPADGDHPYVGMTTQTIHKRVHGPGGHTSPEDIAKDPWKAHIRPGRAGYRQLEVVYDTGDDAENDRLLRRAESYWIDRLHTTYNTVRPIRAAGETRATRRTAVARAKSQRQRDREAQQRAERIRAGSFLVLALALSILAGRLVARMELPWPAAPWIAGPVVGLLAAWWLFFAVVGGVRRVKGRRR